MKLLLKRLSKIYGYSVLIEDIIPMYRNGDLLLTDKEENEILKYLITI